MSNKAIDPKRIKELKKLYRKTSRRDPKTEVIVECLDEIERLRSILEFYVFGRKVRKLGGRI